jgi:hypothetical protein
MKLIQVSDLGLERGKNEIKRERERVDQVEASFEADGGRRMDQSFLVRRGHPEAMTKLGTAVVNGSGSRRGEPSPFLYVSSLFAWVVVVNGDS